MATRDLVNEIERIRQASVKAAAQKSAPEQSAQPAKLMPQKLAVAKTLDLDEYASLAKEIGVAAPSLLVERFKQFLQAKDWPIFALKEVIGYMDAKSLAESKDKAGWQWRPLRDKDNILKAKFGLAATRKIVNGYHGGDIERPASDHYIGPYEYSHVGQMAGMTTGAVNQAIGYPAQAQMQYVTSVAPSQMPVYDKLVPLHALRKIATIEREFKEGKVSFFICDYAPAPAIEHPDPFLMAVIDNPQMASGEGRFVIDFWDEPGFGIDKQLA